MKKNAVFILTLLTVFSLFSGCKKESDDPTNLLTVGKTKAELKNLALYLNTQSTNGYEYYLELVGEGISFGENGYFTGAGSYLEFRLVSSADNGIASGDYVYDSSGTKPVFTYLTSKHCMEWSLSATYDTYPIASGTLTVTRDASNYEITFSGVDSEGRNVSAYYKGSSIFYDWRPTKSSADPAK